MATQSALGNLTTEIHTRRGMMVLQASFVSYQYASTIRTRWHTNTGVAGMPSNPIESFTFTFPLGGTHDPQVIHRWFSDRMGERCILYLREGASSSAFRSPVLTTADPVYLAGLSVDATMPLGGLDIWTYTVQFSGLTRLYSVDDIEAEYERAWADMVHGP